MACSPVTVGAVVTGVLKGAAVAGKEEGDCVTDTSDGALVGSACFSASVSLIT